MRTPCQPAIAAQDSGNVAVFESARRTQAARRPAGNAPSGSFCRRFYRGL